MKLEPIVGRYLHLELDGRPHRLYFEEAGKGIPLLCLHTAGSDGRQYRAVLNDASTREHFRVIAFDMPWHGKSSPPAGWEREDYRLTTTMYTGMVMQVAKALELERPVVMGCSIGGRIVLDLALRHASALRALIGLQSGAFVERYYDAAWLDHAEVHGGRACGAVAYGLMSPLSPRPEVWETAWHYMQGGPGVFTGDLYLLTGEYDYSASPRDTQAVAERVKGVKFTVMKGLGHFPMSENPEAFLGYLRPVLEEIRLTRPSPRIP